MTSRAAIHDKPITENGVVENVILADDIFCNAVFAGRWLRLADDDRVGPGYEWDAKAQDYCEPS